MFGHSRQVPRDEGLASATSSPESHSSGVLRLVRALILIVAAIFLGIFVTGVSQELTVSSVEEDLLFVHPAALDFGEVWVQDAFRWRIPIRNVSDSTITIRGYTVSCQCTEIKPDSLTLDPGEASEIQFVIDLRRTRERFSEDEWVRPFSIVVSPDMQTETSRQVVWTITGRVRDPLAVNPMTLAFKEPLEQFGKAPERTITVHATEGVASIAAESDESSASVRIEECDGDRFVAVSPNTSVAAGPFGFSIDLTARLENGSVLPPLKVPVSGVIVADGVCTPSRFVAGIVKPGTLSTETATLSSRSGRPFAVTRIECPSHTKVVPKATEGGSTFLVEHMAQTSGQNEPIQFHCRYEDTGTTFKIPLAISVHVRE